MCVIGVFVAGAALRIWFVLAGPPAFLGFEDAWSYVAHARGQHAQDQVHPLGYPYLLRALHAISADLSWTIAVQHVLGLATAALLYLAVTRMTGSRWAGLIPAAFVLFDGLQLVLEHTLLTEAFFIFLVAAFGYTAIRSVDGGWGWAVAAGGLAARSGLVKSGGLLLVPLLVIALLALGQQGSFLARLRLPAIAAATAIGVIAVYLVGLTGEPGNLKASPSPSGGRVLYSRVAPFADCTRFSPPAGTAALCQTSPAASREGTNYYLWNGSNPAWRRFGVPPAGDASLQAFALSAIAAQPLDYASAVGTDLWQFVDFPTWSYVRLAGDHLSIGRVGTTTIHRDSALPPRNRCCPTPAP